MGLFDHLIPTKQAKSGLFDHLIPAPQAGTDVGSLADLLGMAGVEAPGAVDLGYEAMIPPALARPETDLPPGMDLSAVAPPAEVDPVHQIAQLVPQEHSLADDLEAAWIQAQQIIPGVKTGMAINDIGISDSIVAHEEGQAAQSRALLKEMQAVLPTIRADQQPQFLEDMRRVEEEIAALEAKQAQPEYPAAMDRVEGERDAALDTLTEILPEQIARTKEIQALPQNEVMAKLAQATTWGEAGSALMEDPAGVTVSAAARAAGTTVPSIIAAVVGQAVGGPGAAMAAGGGTGAAIEAGLSVQQDVEKALTAAGVDTSDPEAFRAWLESNPDAFKGVLGRALTRAGVIGGVDAVTAGITGRLAAAAAKSGKAGKIGEAVLSGAVIDPVGEGVGEAGAQLATDGEVHPGDVAMEMLGGLGSGAPMTAGQVAVEAVKRPAGTTAQEAPQAPPAPVVPETPQAPPVALSEAPTTPVTLQPVETHAPAPLQSQSVDQVPPQQPAAVAPQPVQAAPAATEPPAPVEAKASVPKASITPVEPQKRPLTNLLMRGGIVINPNGAAGRELRSQGMTMRTIPGFFNHAGIDDVDNIPAAEHPEIAEILGIDGQYIQREAIMDALMEEAAGRPVRGADQMLIASAWADYQRHLGESGEAFSNDDSPIDVPEPTVAPPNENDLGLPHERTALVQRQVDALVAASGMDAILTPAERAAVVARLDRDGGSIEGAIHDELERSYLNAEYGQDISQAAGTAAGSASTGSENASIPGFDAGEEGRSQADNRGDGRARQGTEEGGSVDLTPEGAQLVIPGAEKITDKERAERAQQAAKRGGNAAPPEDGLFGDPGNRGDLFDEPKDPTTESKKTTTPNESPEARREREEYSRVMGPYRAMRALYERMEQAVRDASRGMSYDDKQEIIKIEKARIADQIREMWLDLNVHELRSWAVDEAKRMMEDINGKDVEIGGVALVDRGANRLARLNREAAMSGLGLTDETAEQAFPNPPIKGYAWASDDQDDAPIGQMVREYRGVTVERTGAEVRLFDLEREGSPTVATAMGKDVEYGTRGPSEEEINQIIDQYREHQDGTKQLPAPVKGSKTGKTLLPPPESGSAKEAIDTTGRRPKGPLSPKFMDFSFTNRTSVYGAAFRAAGVEPDAARNMPMDEQIRIVRMMLEKRFGIRIEMPRIKVRKKNLVGRKVTVERTGITDREALDQMLDAFRQMQMLAHILGVPERAIALEIDGKPLTLSLERTIRGALGMFSWGPDGRKISLPDRSNSFAHEWGHALDHYLNATREHAPPFAKMLSREMDEQGVQAPMSPKRAVTDAFARVMQALYGDQVAMNALVLKLQVEAAEVGADGKSTANARKAMKIMTGIREGRRPPDAYLGQYFKSSAAFDKASGSDGYFVDPAEMFARAFEAWVGRTVSDISDLPHGFLSKGDWAYNSDGDKRLAMTFPKGSSEAFFSIAMSELTHAMSRVMLFGRGAAAKPDDVDINDPNALLRMIPKIGLMEREAQGFRESAAKIKEAVSRNRVKEAMTAPFRGLNSLLLIMAQSTTATVVAMAKRQKNAEAREAFMNIADAIGSMPGQGRVQKENPYQVSVERRALPQERMLDVALAEDFHGRTITDAENAELRQALVEDGSAAADPKTKKLAGHLRDILNTIWYDLKNAGIEVGYQSEYLPRITLVDKVDANPSGFRRQAAKVYALMFEREVVENADDETQTADIQAVIRRLQNARLPTPKGETRPANRLSDEDMELVENWRAARRKLKDLQRRQEKADEPDSFSDRIGEAMEALDDARGEMLDMLKERFADYSAENWNTAVQVGNVNDFDAMGPTSTFLKGRKLPPETDTIMKDYLETNVVNLMRGYIFSTARRIEYAKRFGANDEKLLNMIAAAQKAGATSGETELAALAVASTTGRINQRYRALRQARSLVFFLGNITLLPFAAFSSLAEQSVTGLRSGYMRDSLKAWGENLMMISPKHRKDMWHIARTIGLVNNALRDGFMENRTNADSMDMSHRMNSGLARFYQMNLLSPLTNFQRVAMVPVAHSIILRHLRSTVKDERWLGMFGQSKFANTELNELGIAQEDRAGLLDWLDSLGDIPTMQDIRGPDGGPQEHGYGEMWANAVVRFTNTAIQNPQKSDRPIVANDPTYAAIYGIMSFIIAFQRNVINRTIIRGVNEKTTTAGKGMRVGMNLANAAAPVAFLFFSHLLTTMMREALINGDKWQELEDDDDPDALANWLLSRAFNRTGLTGVLDPLVNIYTGIKYETDMTSMMVGPYGSNMLRNLQKIIGAKAGRNSENTNTAEHNALQAFYALAIQPAAAAAILALTPTGPIATAAGTVGLWAVSRYDTRGDFADALVGEKGAKHEGEPPWWEMGK